ncbi:flippase [Fictibacillus sp. UD]|uniref:flippase n=1 Tax=Fictibacillus sp. UD TaxID=3038777 RepID=UPI0037462649
MSIAKNYFYNLLYQMVTLILPLITIPYISRVLGTEGVGINAYTNSIIQYFILMGTIGITLYGNKEIAYVRDDKVKLSRTFWGIFYLKCITTFISYVLFMLFLIVVGEYHFIFLLQSVFIIAAVVDISWLFMGLEDFKKTVMRNLFVKIIGVICIFLFVKTSNDLWKYVLILSMSQLLGHLSLWFYLPKTVNKIKLKWQDIKRHLIPSLALFIPQFAIQLYIILNKTMLGILSNLNEVGLFDNADKIVKIVLAIVTALGIVMLPRISNTFARGEIEQVKNYIYNSFDFATYLSVPLMFGLGSIALEFAPWFFGPEFTKTGILICIISPIIVLIAWSNVLGQQFLMPVGRIKGYTVSVIVGAVVNFTFNLLLIGRFHSIGAAIATLIAEFSVTSVQLYYVRQDLQIKKLLHSTWKYLISGIIMYLIVRYIGVALDGGVKSIVIQIIGGIISYFVLLFLLKSDLNKKLFGVGLMYLLKVIRR